MAVLLGVFVVPDGEDPQRTLAQIEAADASGLDLVGVQDHPYQRRFLDTWTLLAYAAARTRRIRLVPDVINLPLRPPAVLAKAAASLDRLSGGRLELGLGAGAFWDGIAAMGGPRRSGPESVDALEEAIAILRAFWAMERSITVEGRHYAVRGARPGPAPAHPIGLWLGAYGPRMLALTGRLADGWLPSVPRMPVEEVDERQARIDEAARRAGRDPADVHRVCNFAPDGDLSTWPGQIERLAVEHRFEGFVLSADDDGGDPVGLVRRIGEEVAPRVREALGP
jgi:alkanesulfonate monooxygenase SsuD/methylene tetrahydromethanopterin reductase-like flavin-dependent oxidoreductase (luciferase family)